MNCTTLAWVGGTVSYAALFTEEHEESEPPKNVKHLNMRRYIMLVAVVVVFVCMLAIQVMGINWIGAVAQWTSETFGFVRNENDSMAMSPDSNDRLSDLRNVLVENGVSSVVIPTYIPENYKERGECVNTGNSVFVVEYEQGDSFISVQVRKMGIMGSQIEKSNSNPEIYTVRGVTFYIMTNCELYTAVWESNGYECSIMGAPTKDFLYEMLNSVK